MDADPDGRWKLNSEQAVRYRIHDTVAVVLIDQPPVNALGAAVREGLIAMLHRALADEQAQAILIIGANDRFVAGADIREFGKPRQGPAISDIQKAMERAPKPVICAMDGHALGGGLELALAAHYRIATPRVKLGLPEIQLGLLPGAGGTQRLTRLIGPEAALDLILTGKHIAAPRAAELGIIDHIAEGDLQQAAIAFAKRCVAEGRLGPILIEKADRVIDVDPRIISDVRARNAKKWKGTIAPFKIVDCIEAATRLSPDEGLLFERAAFEACSNDPAHAAMVHLFFAERKAAKVNGISATTRPRSIGSAGIVGAGTMGGGIAMSLAEAGLPVKLLDNTQQALDAGIARIRHNYSLSVDRGSMARAKADAAIAKINPVIGYDHLADVDLVIEAVFETRTIKHDVFRRIDAVARPGAILATNTSALDIDEIASVTRRPQDVIGLHFFSPANVMKLVEVVRGVLASDETVVSAMAFANAIAKVPVLAGNCEGFIGNRILQRYGTEADALLLEGATPWQIDIALKDFGFPMGIYLMRDLAGLDVGWRMRANRIAAGTLDPAAPDYVPLADRLCTAGRFGQKTGAGYYTYAGRTASPDPAVDAMLDQIAAEKNVMRGPIEDEEIVWRILCAMVNEGADIVSEEIAQRASDIDVAYAFGYGFPKYRGGPMFWAEQHGLPAVHDRIAAYAAKYGPRWQPSALLSERAAAGKGWDG